MIEAVIRDIVFALLRLAGAAVVRRHVDEWEAMEAAAELATEARLGPRP